MIRTAGLHWRYMLSIVLRLFPVLLAAAIVTGCDASGNVSLPGSGTGKGAPAPTPEPTATVQGVVQLAEAAPDANAGVTVFLAGTGYHARTDTDGSYRITGVPRGEYNVIAEKAGYQTLTIDRIVLDPERHTKDAPAVVRSAILEKIGSGLDTTTTASASRALGSLVGNVFLQDRDDADGVRVQLEGTMHVTVSDRDGSYRLLNVEPGRYTLTFSHPGFRSFSTEVTVPRGEVGRVDDAALERLTPDGAGGTGSSTQAADGEATQPLSRRELSGTRSIIGLVEIIGVDGQREADYGRVSVALDNSDIVVTPDAQGTFRIPDLPPGIYKVTAALDGSASTMQSQVADLTTQDSVQIKFQFSAGAAEEAAGVGSVTGRIVPGSLPTPPGGTPPPPPTAAGASVGLSDTQHIVMTGSDGVFTFEKVPAGVYTLIVSKEGFESLEVPNVQVVAGQELDLGELTLEPLLDYPRVIATSPEEGARNVLVTEELTVLIRFSKPMDRESLLRSIRISPQANYTPYFGRGAHPQADEDALVLVFSNWDANLPIRYNSNYRVSVLSSAMDKTGLNMREEFTLSFSTGGVGVASTYPPDKSEGFIVDQANYPVQIIFNGPVDPRTLNSDTIRIRPSRSTYRIDSQSNPQTGFTAARIMTTYLPNTVYTVTVTRRVRTVNGQPLANTPYTFSFRSWDQTPVPLPDPVTR